MIRVFFLIPLTFCVISTCTAQSHTVMVEETLGWTPHCPHDYYWTDQGINPGFTRYTIGNSSGYKTKWEIKNEKLYLLQFDAYERNTLIDVSDKVIGGSLPLLMTWYTGEFHVAYGRKNKHPRELGIYEQVFPKVDVFFIENGLIKRVIRLENSRLPMTTEFQIASGRLQGTGTKSGQEKVSEESKGKNQRGRGQ